jgi:hypothetical protein
MATGGFVPHVSVIRFGVSRSVVCRTTMGFVGAFGLSTAQPLRRLRPRRSGIRI